MFCEYVYLYIFGCMLKSYRSFSQFILASHLASVSVSHTRMGLGLSILIVHCVCAVAQKKKFLNFSFILLRWKACDGGVQTKSGLCFVYLILFGKHFTLCVHLISCLRFGGTLCKRITSGVR